MRATKGKGRNIWWILSGNAGHEGERAKHLVDFERECGKRRGKDETSGGVWAGTRETNGKGRNVGWSWGGSADNEGEGEEGMLVVERDMRV